ncbi:MAG: apolipoprotein N-acyltransferase [Spirochaetales bacterium]|nr:apolipoprotein N-acyltransferase [Spirochaetales bacterium]
MKLNRIFLVVFSGLLFSIALPNELFTYGNWILGLFCLSPLFIALTLTKSFKSAAVLGIIFGTVTSLVSNYWLMFFQEFSIWTLGGTTIGYALYNTILALFLFGFTKYSRNYRTFLIAAGWALYEYLKSTGFLGYPWGLIAYPVHVLLPVVQFTDITGIWGLSFFMALINGLIAEIMLKYFYHYPPYTQPKHSKSLMLKIVPQPLLGTAVFTLMLAVLIIAYGYIKLNEQDRRPSSGLFPEKKLHILLVQQNTDSWALNGERKSILINEKLTVQGIKSSPQKPDLIVWSETSLMHPAVGYGSFFENYPKENPLLPFIRKQKTFFLIGAPVLLKPLYSKKTRQETIRAMNAAVLFNPRGDVVKYYGKQHPVPFAESIPFWDIPWVREFFQRFIGVQDVWVMGNDSTIFSVPLKDGSTVKFGTPICFEDAFSGLCRTFINRGANLFINITNDSWSRMVSAETQHFVAAKFRAIENKRFLIRSTTAGVTGIVSPWGKTLKSIPLFKKGYLTYTVPLYRNSQTTIYTRYGDYFPILLMIVLLSFLIYRAVHFLKFKSDQ